MRRSEAPIMRGVRRSSSRPPTISGRRWSRRRRCPRRQEVEGQRADLEHVERQSCTPNLSSLPRERREPGVNMDTVKGADTGKRLRVKVVAENSAGSDGRALGSDRKGQGGRWRGRRRQSRGPGTLAVARRPARSSTPCTSADPVTSRRCRSRSAITVKATTSGSSSATHVSMVSTPVATSSPMPAETGLERQRGVHDPARVRPPIKNGDSAAALRQGLQGRRP